jgi:hypothetical protein
MRKAMFGVLALAVLFASVAAFAASPAKSQEISGTVKSIDTKNRTVVVDTGSATETFKLESWAAIEQSNPHKALTFADLKTGERVQVHYTMNGSSRLASKLEVLPQGVASNTGKPKS